MTTLDRTEALTAAKVATRAYARDPTDANASQVEAAWARVRGLETASLQRRWRRARSRATANTQKH